MSRERIRTVKPEFFRDEKIKSLSRDARLLAIGLISRSDDRGRQANEERAIVGHTFPGGDVSLRQLAKWTGDILAVGFARLYGEAPFEYLWLPNFWKHQVINKPTESDYPPHPEERFAHIFPIKDAIRAFRKEQDREAGRDERPDKLPEFLREEVRPPRAGAHSVPIRSVVDGTSQGTAWLDAIMEATSILRSVPRWVDLDEVGVENAAATDPDADLVAAARLAAVWGSDGSWDMGPAASLRAAMAKLAKEQSAGRSKAERGADGIAALRELGAPV